IAEQSLMSDERSVLGCKLSTWRQIREQGEVLLDPRRVGMGGSEVGFDSLVIDDVTLGGVAQKHLPRAQPSLADDPCGLHRNDTDFGGEHDETVVALPVPRRSQTVAIEDRADQRA